MPTAAIMPTTSRRALLAGAPALLLTTVASSGPTHPDAEAIALTARIEAGKAESDRIMAPYWRVVVIRHTPTEQARLDELTADYRQTMARLAALRVTTRDGFRAKARALLVQMGVADDWTPSPDSDEYLTWSLCRDMTA